MRRASKSGMAGLTWSNQLRHGLIRSRWKRWLFPVVCVIPYVLSLLWLLSLQQGWIAQVMLTPLLMMALLALLTWTLARLEFRQRR